MRFRSHLSKRSANNSLVSAAVSGIPGPLLTRLSALSKVDGEFGDVELEHDSRALGHRTMVASALRLSCDGAESGAILLSVRDTTGQKRIEGEVGEMLIRLRAITSMGKAVIITGPRVALHSSIPPPKNSQDGARTKRCTN